MTLKTVCLQDLHYLEYFRAYQSESNSTHACLLFVFLELILPKGVTTINDLL